MGGFEGSWGDLGASWERLGASWGGLGPSWSGLMGLCWRNLIFDQFWDRFGIDFGAQKAPQKGRKWSSKRTKIEHKIQHKKLQLSRPSWIRLGPVLGRFVVDLGIKNSENLLVFIGFRENHVLKKIRPGKASWTELGSILVAKRVQKGSQIGAKMGLKNDQQIRSAFNRS